jgi:hypothetical protein
VATGALGNVTDGMKPVTRAANLAAIESETSRTHSRRGAFATLDRN